MATLLGLKFVRLDRVIPNYQLRGTVKSGKLTVNGRQNNILRDHRNDVQVHEAMYETIEVIIPPMSPPPASAALTTTSRASRASIQ